ncbi:hypothetical protein ACFU53_13640 [Streptomyces sp. NPDC057474]|uniref:hypothetical protein n=1 Tax=Streptomyces sp. NPDC057474 TaxID=3346144 RepID=UPI00367D9776
MGFDLGCALIDQRLVKMVREAFAGNENFAKALDEDGSQEMLRLLCRRMKESQFTGTGVRLQELQASRTS